MPVDQSPAFQFYAKDFWVGTAMLSLAERGAYITLLAFQWDSGVVPGEAVARARVLGVPRREADVVWARVRGKFVEQADGTFVNLRLEAERAKQQAYRAAHVANGQRGAQARWHGEAIDSPLEEHSQAIDSPVAKSMAKNASSSSSSSSLRSVQTPVVTSTHTLEPEVDPLQARAAHLVDRYKELFYEHRQGARYHSRLHLDFQKACDLVRTWTDDARLEKLAIIVLTTDDDWVSRTDRGFGVFASRASWADDRLRAWEIEHQVQT